MIKYLLCFLLSFSAVASEYQFSVGQSKFEHAWRGPDNVSNFSFYADNYGLAYINNNNIGFSLTHYKAKSNGRTEGRYKDLYLEMDNVVSVGLFYRFKVSDFYISPGISWNYVNAGVRNKSTGYYDYDRDDDKGYFINLDYVISSDFIIRYNYSSHSRITEKPYDEWTRSHSLNLVYRF